MHDYIAKEKMLALQAQEGAPEEDGIKSARDRRTQSALSERRRDESYEKGREQEGRL